MWLEGMEESQKRSHDPYPTSAWSLLNGETHRKKMQSSLGRHSRCSYFSLHFSERLSTGRLGTHETIWSILFHKLRLRMGTYLWPTFRRFGSDSCGIPRQLWFTWAEAASYEQAKDFVDANRQVTIVAWCCMCCKMPCLLPPNQSKQC